MLKRFMFSAAMALILMGCGGKSETVKIETPVDKSPEVAEKTTATKQTEEETEVDLDATFEEMLNEEETPAFDDEIMGTAYDAYGSDIKYEYEETVQKAKENYDKIVDDATDKAKDIYGDASKKAKDIYKEATEAADKAIENALDNIKW